jgi:hypothetical protein
VKALIASPRGETKGGRWSLRGPVLANCFDFTSRSIAWFRLTAAAILLATLALVLPASSPAATGPIASYAFNETSGEIARDSSNRHDATVEGGAKWAEGKYGNALSFDPPKAPPWRGFS